MKLEYKKIQFREYVHEANRCPIKIVTPDGEHFIHTFFDLNPISPSGRYLACLRLPFVDRIPKHDDFAEVCIIDLEEESMAVAYKTYGYGLCVGAHICWGSDDEHLYFNDKEEDDCFAVEFNILTGESRRLADTVYQVTKDNKYIFSPNLGIVNHVQKGYGIQLNQDLYDTMPTTDLDEYEGLWRVDTETNEKVLIMSKRQVYELLPDKRPFENARIVFFHTKISPDQKRLMQMIRCTIDGVAGQLRYIVTMDFDGGNAKIALPYEFWIGDSHHPDWHPNSQDITMNLRLNEVLRFYQFKQDGSSLRMIFPNLLGSGHPSFSKDESIFLVDAYTYDPVTNEKGEVPIRWIDSKTAIDNPICYIWTLEKDVPFDLRRDPHPVWDKEDKNVIFNGVVNDCHQILIADVSKLKGE